jgi:hypothetical protein
MTLNLEYYYSEDDEDEAETYLLSNFFRASNTPLANSYSNKIIFKIDGYEVYNAIKEYVKTQLKLNLGLYFQIDTS